VIGCQNQSLGKTVAAPGTVLALHYSSDRTLGYSGGAFAGIRLSGETVPESLRRIELSIVVAGQRINQTFPPLPNQTYQLSWDGNDPYGRLIQGGRSIRILKSYCYDLTYAQGAVGTRSWARLPEGPFTTSPPSPRSAGEICLIRRRETRLGGVGPQLQNWDQRSLGLGGWSLSAHHTYDPNSRTIYLGTGERRTVQPFALTLQSVIDDGLSQPRGLALASDGSLYIADTNSHVIRRVAPDGSVTLVAGTGANCGDQDTGNVETECGNGGLATAAQLANPFDVAVESDGGILIADTGNICVRRVSPAGIISTVAGDCVDQFLDLFTAEGLQEASGRLGGSPPCESCPATETTLNLPMAVLPTPGGGFWVSEGGRVRKTTPDGLIEWEIGDPEAGALGDGGPARDALLNGPQGLARDADGNLYIADRGHNRVRRVSREGIITTFAGNGDPDFEGDGEVAGASGIGSPQDVMVRRDGSVFITVSSSNGDRVLRVDSNGRAYTVAGGGEIDPRSPGAPIRSVNLGAPWGMVEAPDGAVHFADIGWASVFRAGDPLPGYSGEELLIPSRSGSVVYEFDLAGRHLRTIDTLTGADRYVFGYDGAGRLVAVTDGDGKATEIERDGAGNPTAIVGPFGHTTTLELDANGWLEDVTTPEEHNDHFVYTEDGLLLSHTDPRGEESVYTYLPSGQLKTATSRAGTTTMLTRFGFDEDYRVVVTSPLGTETQYHVDNLATNDQARTKTIAAGFSITTERSLDGRLMTTYPDGTTTEVLRSGDPRFGMAAPFLSEYRLTTPEGRESILNRSRTVMLSDPLDPLSLEEITESITLNGRTYIVTFDADTHVFNTTTPEGRTSVVAVDDQNRPLSIDAPGLGSLTFTYDILGRLDTVRQGTGAAERIVDVDFDTEGRVHLITDPLNRTFGFTYDDDDRLVSRTLPGSRTIGFAYDENDNLETLTPPGRPAHSFDTTTDDLLALYNPPDAGFSPDTTVYVYDQDRRLDLITRPDGGQIDPEYDGFGRISQITFPTGTITYAYSTTTGQVETIAGPGSQTLSYAYDGFLLTSRTSSGQVAGTVEHTHTDDFWVESESVNGGNTISFGYDDDGLLEAAGALDVEHDPDTGIESGTTLGLVTTSLVTDPVFAEIAEMSASYDGTEIFRIDYTVRDKLGRIVEREETIDSTTDTYAYGYDDAGRLESVTKNSTLIASYTYDDNGNRLSYDGPFGTITSTTHDAQDRLLEYGDITFTHTANGELASKTENGETATYTYDALGNLRSVALPDDIDITYVVDGVGRRVGKKIEGKLVQGFLYKDALNPVAELDGSNSLVSRFVYGSRPTVPDYMIKGGVTYRIISDHLGSVRLVINAATGSVAQQLAYDEYGRITQNTNAGFQPFGFAGGLYDHQTGLVHFGARDYDPSIGRWTAKDPIGFKGDDTNLYAYAALDPVNKTDVAGRANRCYRPLDGAGGILSELFPSPGSPDFLARLNQDPLHDHFWFDDGTNFGFFSDGVRPDTHPREDYLCQGRLLDDTTLLEAIEAMRQQPGEYQASGANASQNNCHDWADRVMEEYERRRLEETRRTGVDPERQFVWNRLLNQETPLWQDGVEQE
jgi:RHS repeat-associated protein